MSVRDGKNRYPDAYLWSEMEFLRLDPAALARRMGLSKSGVEKALTRHAAANGLPVPWTPRPRPSRP